MLKSFKGTVLLVGHHLPIDSELMKSWIEDGYRVYLMESHYGLYGSRSYSGKYGAQTLAEIPEGVRIGIPEKEPTVMVCENGWDIYRLLKLKLSRLWLGCKIVHIFYWFPRALGLPMYLLAKRVSVSRYLRDSIRKSLKIDSAVAYPPVDTEFYKPSKGWKNRKIALVIGNGFRNRPDMGYDQLIGIFKKVHELDDGIRLLLLGADNDPRDYPEYVKCVFAKKEDIPKYFNSASCIFFIVTKNVITPHSMVNAMSCAKNVVAFDIPPFREIVKDGYSGHLILDFDTRLFAKKVVELTKKPNARVGANARQTILKKCERRLVAGQILGAAGIG